MNESAKRNRQSEISPAYDAPLSPSFGEALKAWFQIGILSFGGPAAQISLMYRVVVEEKKWLREGSYLNALSFCMLLPGPETMQLATYTGWRLHGIAGGLAAGLLFILPGAFVVLILAMVYALYGATPLMATLFVGVKATVIVIVIDALLRISRKALHRPGHWFLAALAFVALFFFALPFPLIMLLAAVFGYVFLPVKKEAMPETALPNGLQTFKIIWLWLMIWLLPLLVLDVAFGTYHILPQIGWFFSKLAVASFGGAYAVLAYMGQDVVSSRGWLAAGQMMDGLGLAETTPGPLILVTEFVGCLAAHGASEMPRWHGGIAGALVALWATFAPCFLWIFAGAPYIEWLNSQPRLKGALSGITAAVAGVILNLSIWFALHVFFKQVYLLETGGLSLWLPDIASLDGRVILLTMLSSLLILWKQQKIPIVLFISALSAWGISLF